MSIQSNGGKARAANLSAERRSQISSAAANARWAKAPRTAQKSITVHCTCCISPNCAKEVVVVVPTEEQARRTILKLNWIVMHDHERIYGYTCPQCVKAHAPGAERVAPTL